MPACCALVCASGEFAFQPPCMHMYHLLFRLVWFEGDETQRTAFQRSCLKKMCCSVWLSVNAGPTCCSCGLCKHSSLITIRKLSLNSLAPWLVQRAKICIQNKALEIYEWYYYTRRCKENNAWVRKEHCQLKSVSGIDMEQYEYFTSHLSSPT